MNWLLGLFAGLVIAVVAFFVSFILIMTFLPYTPSGPPLEVTAGIGSLVAAIGAGLIGWIVVALFLKKADKEEMDENSS